MKHLFKLSASITVFTLFAILSISCETDSPQNEDTPSIQLIENVIDEDVTYVYENETFIINPAEVQKKTKEEYTETENRLFELFQLPNLATYHDTVKNEIRLFETKKEAANYASLRSNFENGNSSKAAKSIGNTNVNITCWEHKDRNGLVFSTTLIARPLPTDFLFNGSYVSFRGVPFGNNGDNWDNKITSLLAVANEYVTVVFTEHNQDSRLLRAFSPSGHAMFLGVSKNGHYIRNLKRRKILNQPFGIGPNWNDRLSSVYVYK